MKNIYNQRLLKFAEHLAKITNHPEREKFEIFLVIGLKKFITIIHEIKYSCWIFEELPVIFNEWSYQEKFGNTAWEYGIDKEGTMASAIDFFGLTFEECSHLFSLDGFQNQNLFGGKKLSNNSDGPDIAINIIELVKRRM